MRPSSASAHIFPGCCLTSSTARSESASGVASNCSSPRRTASGPRNGFVARTIAKRSYALPEPLQREREPLDVGRGRRSRTRPGAGTAPRRRTSARSRRSPPSRSTRRPARRPRSGARSRSRTRGADARERPDVLVRNALGARAGRDEGNRVRSGQSAAASATSSESTGVGTPSRSPARTTAPRDRVELGGPPGDDVPRGRGREVGSISMIRVHWAEGMSLTPSAAATAQASSTAA